MRDGELPSAMRDGELPSVMLVRSLEAEPSMLRFGTELEQALRASGEVRLLESLTTRPRRLGPLEPYAARYMRTPLALAIRRRTPAVFHITDHSLGHLAALTPSRRTVISCHDLVLLRARESTVGFRARPWSVARFAWSTSFLRGVARVICPSQATKADLVRLRGLAPERIAVVPNGISPRFEPLTPAARAQVRERLGLAGPVILHVASGQPYKNVDATLRVLAQLRADDVMATLIRVGAPLTRADRALAAELRVEHAVRDLGTVSDARLVEIYGAADTLLFPSHAEGFGWPVLEAMACGTAVVTSDIPALSELSGAAGLRAGADDVAGLTRSVSAVLRDGELRARLAACGRARAAGYSWAATAHGYASVYREVV